MFIQAGDVVDNPVVQGETTASEVMTFVDESSGEVNDVGYVKNPIASASSTVNTSLENFLSRPTLIDTRTWTTATANGVLGAVIEPWFAFLNNAVILRKLQNYAFLRAKLCLKVIVNGTPFHFGCMRVAYEPNVNATTTGNRLSKIRTNPTTALPLITPYSQLPGCWVLPADNAGGEIKVPFFTHSNWLNLRLAADVATMGRLTYYIAFPLSVASASGSTSITIDTFAWLEDVELNGSTAELLLQAKDKYDGPVSSIASAVASAASSLDSVPVIGKFMRASAIGAGAVASIASIFGFTNTPVIDDVHAIVPTVGSHLASSEISGPVQKLALDPKQELTIDPTIHGLDNEDELSIECLVKKKSALVMGGWSTADAVGTVIFNARISPQLFGRVPIVDGGAVQRANRVYHTPLSYTSMMFTHWRGDICLEFQVICTKFHKGRLKVSWDPSGQGGATALAENTAYTTILDIGENNKAVFRVPYHQLYGFQRCRGITADNWSAGNAMPTNPQFDNGLLIVSVLTPLMSPVSPQNVGVLVSIYGADNLEFANPSAQLGEKGSATAPPSFFAIQGKDVYDVEAEEVVFGDTGGKHPNRYDAHFGERIVSLRTLLHRYSLYDTSLPDRQAYTRVALYRKSYTRLPPSFGYDPQGQSTANLSLTAGTTTFNYCPTHPITYVAGMFGAVRGSVNYLVNTSCDLYPYIGDIRVQRTTGSAEAAHRIGLVSAGINTATTKSAFTRFMNFTTNFHGTCGAAITNSQQNGALNWNYPMMTGVNFCYTDPTYSIPGNTFDQTDRECSLLEAYIKQSTANTVTDLVTLNTYAGTGPDFTCLWFLCCPTLDYYDAIPVAP